MRINPSAFIPIFFLFAQFLACGKNEIKADNEAKNGNEKTVQSSQVTERVMLADVQTGESAREISAGKLDASLALMTKAVSGYEFIPLSARDSVSALLKSEQKSPTAAALAERLGVQKLIFVRVDRLHNILRIALTTRSGKDFSVVRESVGYALARYRNEKTGAMLYDPTILEAVQRAFINAEAKPALFSALKAPMNIQAAEPMAVGSIHYVETGVKQKWSLFDDKILSSYEAVLEMVNIANASGRFVCYDVDSRDSLYALEKLYGIENYNAPSSLELRALERMEVKYFLTGKLEKNPQGAELTIMFCVIQGGKLNLIRSEKAGITEDSRVKFMETVQQLTKKCLE